MEKSFKPLAPVSSDPDRLEQHGVRRGERCATDTVEQPGVSSRRLLEQNVAYVESCTAVLANINVLVPVSTSRTE